MKNGAETGHFPLYNGKSCLATSLSQKGTGLETRTRRVSEGFEAFIGGVLKPSLTRRVSVSVSFSLYGTYEERKHAASDCQW